jgi:predicted metal-binding membrane protein
MLLMFTIGAGSIGWRLLLGALMAIEKNPCWGKPFARNSVKRRLDF